MRVFGCKCFKLVKQPERRNKLAPKATLCVMMGYMDSMKAYKLYDVENQKMTHGVHVTFMESEFFNDSPLPDSIDDDDDDDDNVATTTPRPQRQRTPTFSRRPPLSLFPATPPTPDASFPELTRALQPISTVVNRVRNTVDSAVDALMPTTAPAPAPATAPARTRPTTAAPARISAPPAAASPPRTKAPHDNQPPSLSEHGWRTRLRSNSTNPPSTYRSHFKVPRQTSSYTPDYTPDYAPDFTEQEVAPRASAFRPVSERGTQSERPRRQPHPNPKYASLAYDDEVLDAEQERYHNDEELLEHETTYRFDGVEYADGIA
ncbi:hypothetical protein DYB32_010219 [Aphanomyces invadans]|uniref:Retroviral polymerase SH3-like domain-containing protein n=1 Tax=Aphanomyces invadans TaxID=157072 RepID=A0A418AI52_9STRA|nr:hypothetical protein DYB32_010219 [Aphanomyces invadans]